MIKKKKNIEIASLKTSVMKQRSGRGHTWDPTTAAAFDYESVFKRRISTVDTETASELFMMRVLFLVVRTFWTEWKHIAFTVSCHSNTLLAKQMKYQSITYKSEVSLERPLR